MVMIASCRSKKGIITKKKDVVEKKEVVLPEKEVEVVPKEEKTPVFKTNSTEEYIRQYKDIAISEMNQYQIPASITLAQGILESGSGKGRLAVKANNHFGIKCHGWTGKKIYHDDDALQECFRKYDHPSSSFRDHSEFLSGRKRYAKLFKLRLTDYKGWAKELRRAGYATDKRYPQKLISLIERYKLYRFDDTKNLEALGEPLKHVVVKGETLYSISLKYDVSVEQLMQLNGLESNTISIGQELVIRDNK